MRGAQLLVVRAQHHGFVERMPISVTRRKEACVAFFAMGMRASETQVFLLKCDLEYGGEPGARKRLVV